MSDNRHTPAHSDAVESVGTAAAPAPAPATPSSSAAHVPIGSPAPAGTPAPALSGAASVPAISVVVPVYNAARYLTECLDSLARQTFGDIEVICVDDGSTDGSADILRDYRGLGRRLRVVTQANAGAAAARNRGLDLARGTYVLFVDADDFIRLDACQLLMDQARSSNADIVVFGGKTFPTSTWADDGFARTRTVRHDAIDAFFFEPGCYPLMCNKLYRRAFIEAEHLRFSTDLVLGEDNVFQFSLFPAAKTIAFIPDKLYFYRIHGQSAFNRMAGDGDVRLPIYMSVVEHVFRLWHERGYSVGHEFDLLNWAIEFMSLDSARASLATREAVGQRLLALLNGTIAPRIAAALSPLRLSQLRHLAGARSQREANAVLSVVVSPRRGAALDADTLTSIQRLTGGAVEILVDTSRADAATQALAASDARAREFPTLSQAVEAARGTYLLFVTLGATYSPTLIPQLLDAVDSTVQKLEAAAKGAGKTGAGKNGAGEESTAGSHLDSALVPDVSAVTRLAAPDATPVAAPPADDRDWQEIVRWQQTWRTKGVDAVIFADVNGLLEHADPIGLIHVNASTVLDDMLVYPADVLDGGVWRLSSLATENKLLARNLVVSTMHQLAAGPEPQAAQDPGTLALASLAGAQGILPTNIPLLTLRTIAFTDASADHRAASDSLDEKSAPEQAAAQALAADLASSLAMLGRVVCPSDAAGSSLARARHLEFARAQGAWLVALLDMVRSPQVFASLYAQLRDVAVKDLDADSLKDAGHIDPKAAESLALMLAGTDAQSYFVENASKLIDHLSAENSRNLAHVSQLSRDVAEAKVEIERYFHSATYRVGRSVIALPKALINAVRKLRR